MNATDYSSVFFIVPYIMLRSVNVQIAELVKDWPCTVKGSMRTDIQSIEDDARKITPGALYIARQGKNYNGKEFIKEAVEKGATAIAIDDELLYDSIEMDVPIVWVPNCESFIAYASAKIYGFPSEALSIIAITGTNGKTTVTHLIGQLLNKLNQQVIVIGTNGIYVNGVQEYGHLEKLTTLQAKDLHFICSEAIRREIPYIVLEASSMGLAKHRLDYCEITLGVFLNITEEHIEDHGSYEKYKQAKQILMKLAKKVIINNDDATCRSIGIASKRKAKYYGKANHVDYHIQHLIESTENTVCCIQYKDERHVVTMPVIGEYQTSNVLAAISSVTELGFPLNEICAVIPQLTLPEGRFARIINALDLSVYIDYAHTPDAMKMILQTIRKKAKSRVIVVFSCGGDRDHMKRPKMGMIASAFADYIILTTDNARSESPEQINDQIKEGFSSYQKYEVILERKEAIEKALKMAQRGDTVVILGKGHEKTQQIGSSVDYFSDHDCVREIVKQLENELRKHP